MPGIIAPFQCAECAVSLVIVSPHTSNTTDGARKVLKFNHTRGCVPRYPSSTFTTTTTTTTTTTLYMPQEEGRRDRMDRTQTIKVFHSFLPRVTYSPTYFLKKSNTHRAWFIRNLENQCHIASIGSDADEYVQLIVCVLHHAATTKACTLDPVTFFKVAAGYTDPDPGTTHDNSPPDGDDSTDGDGDALFYCKYCSKPAQWSQRQTRSADEPMTVFVHCKSCGIDYRL